MTIGTRRILALVAAATATVALTASALIAASGRGEPFYARAAGRTLQR
jgi:hypothetical protein